MSTMLQPLQTHTIALTEVFVTHTAVTLHETDGDECHAFEMYDARNAMVREAAYFCVQERGFEPGHELEDWLAAEHEVDARLFARMAPVGFVG